MTYTVNAVFEDEIFVRERLMRTKWILSFIIVGALIIGLVYYQVNYISLWGFTLAKNDLNNAIIYTDDTNYMVTNRQVVIDLAEKVTKMKRSQKVESMRFPPGATAQPFEKLLLQTKDHVTFGGSIWNLSSGKFLNSNGYYWVVSGELISALEMATKDSQTTHSP